MSEKKRVIVVGNSKMTEALKAALKGKDSEPVSSPQATRPDDIERLAKAYAVDMEIHDAAQPAAGTTPHIHECDHETEGEHVCRCVICGKHIGTPPSEGTTPQAERGEAH